MGHHAEQAGVVETLEQRFEVVKTDTIDGAMAALRKDDFVGVISDSGDFLPLERALVTQQASMILNTIGEGVCVVDREGRPNFMNKKMLAWPPHVREYVRRICSDAMNFFAGLTPEQLSNPIVTRCRRYNLPIDDSQQFLELMASPVLTPNGQVVQVVAVVWDATATRRLQQKIDAIDLAGRELMKLDADNLRAHSAVQRLKLLEEKIVGYAKQLMHFDHFAIYLRDPSNNKLELVMSAGLPADALNVELYALAEGNGISGYVGATGRSYICPDVVRDPRYVQGLDNAMSSLTVPLWMYDKIIGIFNVESRQRGAFSEDDRQFAEIFGRYIAMALNTLDLLVKERVEVSHKVADNVISELEAPLNDIEVDVRDVLDDFIGDEAMRRRIEQILVNVGSIRSSLQQVQKGPNTTVLGVSEIEERLTTADPIIHNARILVVDDEPNIRQTIAALLRKYEARVTVATNGDEAIKILEGDGADLVLSDIKMPDKTGYDVFASARKLESPPPVILMTGFGYDPGHCIVRASQEGLAAVLYKPFRAEQLLDEVRKALQHRSVTAHA